MRSANLIALPLLTAALCTGLASASPAQGGWRQWDVQLHDGRRLEANPLGAPDDAHLSLSVAGYDGRERRVARKRVHYVAARPTAGDSLPNAPSVASCQDAIVRRDGTRTVGHITLARVRWSAGVVVQRGDTIALRDVAYLVFAAPRSVRADCRHAKSKKCVGCNVSTGARNVSLRGCRAARTGREGASSCAPGD